MEDRDRKGHWRRTTTLALVVLVVLAALTAAVWSRIGALNGIVILGFPLGFYLAAQGLVVLAVVAAFWFTVRQERLDRKYGIEDD